MDLQDKAYQALDIVYVIGLIALVVYIDIQLIEAILAVILAIQSTRVQKNIL